MTQHRSRGLRWKVIVGALLLFGGAMAALRTREAAEGACTLARRELPELLGLDVGIGSCELDPLTQTVKLRGVSLFEPGAETPIVAADEAEVSVASVSPFFGAVELDSIRLIRPRVSLDLSRPRPEKEDGGCSLEALDRLDIRRLEIKNAELRLLLPDQRAVEVTGVDVAWKRRRGRAEIRVQANQGRVMPRHDAELELSALLVDARFDRENERLEITRAELELDGVSVSGSGDVDGLCDAQLALEASVFLPMTTVARAANLHSPVGGHLWSRISVEGSARAPTITAEVSAQDLALGRYHPGTFDASLALDGTTVRIEKLETAVGEGTLRAKGELRLTEKLPLALEVDLQRVELGPALARGGLTGAWVNFPATGKGRFAGTLLPSPNLEGDAELQAGRFVLASRAYDAATTTGKTILEFERGEVSGTFQVLPDRVELIGLRVDSDRSTVVGNTTLWFAPEKGLLVRGEATSVDLSDFGHLAGLPWRGTGTGQFVVQGPYSDVRASAVMSFNDLDFWKLSLGVLQGRIEYAKKVLSFPAASGQKGKTQYAGSGELTFGEGPLLARGEVKIEKGRIEDVVDVLMPMHANMDVLQGVLDGDLSGTVKVDCPSDAFAGVVDFKVKNTRYYERGLGDARLVLRFEDGDRAVLQKTTFTGPLGTTVVDGTWDFDGPLDYRFRIDGNLEEVVGRERARQLGLSGNLALVGTVGGDTTIYTVNSYLTSPGIRFAEKDLGSSHLELRLVGRDLQVWGRPFDGARTNLKMKVKDPYPWEITGRIALPEIRPLLPQAAIAQGVSGGLSATFDALGNLRDSKAIEGAATIDKLTLTRGDFSGANDGRIELTFRGGKLTVDDFLFRGPNTRLSMAGTAGPKALDLNVHGSFDLRLLESFLPVIERTSGRVELTAVAGGTLEAPTLAGTASLSDARLSVRDQPVSLRGVSGRLEFSEARVLVQDFNGVLNDGRVRLAGDVRMDRFTPKHLELRLQLDEVSARPMDYLPFTTTGELNLAGNPDRQLTLSGDLDIVRLRYDQPLVLDTFLADVKTARVGEGSGDTPRRRWLVFDVAVHANGDVRIDNNLAKAKLRGDLRLTGDNLRPGLIGNLEAAEGSQIFFRGNTFQVTQGLVEFKEKHEIDPVYDLHANTQVREYLVSLHSFGRVRDPQVILSADPDLPEADILSLLTVGVTSRDQSDAFGTSVGVGVDALFNVTGMDKQVQKFLPKNPLLRDLSFHIASSYNEASGSVEPTAQLESKFLTEKLQLQLARPMMTGKGTRAQAEYRFDDRLAGQLQWDNEQGENLPNLGVDLKLRWEVE